VSDKALQTNGYEDRSRHEADEAGWLTTLQSIHEIGLSSLSQRVSVKRREGVNIIDKWVKTESGSRVKAYRLG
jgi:hypothetical protein